MSSSKSFIRLTRTLPVDPALGLDAGTVWPVCPPPKGGSTMKTWIMSKAGREVALLRHEWEEVATVILDPCPHCGHDAHVIPAVKRGLFVAECVRRSECSVYPMTEALPSEAEASDAWNSRRFASESLAPLTRREPKRFYRVCRPESRQGLWYHFDGRPSGVIHDEFPSLRNSGLAMDFDPELVGWLSAVESLDDLWKWFSKEDMAVLEDRGWFIHEYEATAWKFYGRFQHPVICKTSSIPVRCISITTAPAPALAK